MDSTKRLTLNVGGKIFVTTTATLHSLPNTRLGRLAKDTSNLQQPNTELFFDRNPEIMNSLLDLYRTGELHLPKNLCAHTAERELEFWEVPVEIIHECCYKTFYDHKRNADMTIEIDNFLTNAYETKSEIDQLSTWNKIWLIMERPNLCRLSKAWSVLYFLVVFLSVVLYGFETSMEFRQYGATFYDYADYYNLTRDDFEAQLDLMNKYSLSLPFPWLRHTQEAIFLFFFLEFLARLVTCPRKRHFLRQPKNWFDLLLVVHDGLGILLERVVLRYMESITKHQYNALVFFYSLSVLRAMRIFYLAKNFDAMKVLLLSTRASLKVLAMLAVCVLSLATLFGASAWLSELLTETFTISSMPYGMWYAIVTMTTVGYGDVVPASLPGRLVGVLCAFSGVIMMALPIAVIASNFSDYHDNLVTREQLRKRSAFSSHLDFSLKEDEGGTARTRGKAEKLGPAANPRSNGMTVLSGRGDSNSGSCFTFRLPGQRSMKRGRKNQVSDSRTTLEEYTELEMPEAKT